MIHEADYTGGCRLDAKSGTSPEHMEQAPHGLGKLSLADPL
jgi:hypothetical protein